MNRQDSDSGFTLIEALVAMAVLAVGAVSLLTATEGHAVRISAVTDRVIARWVADDALTQTRLGLPVDGLIEMMNREFQVTVTETPTDDVELMSIDISVAASTDDGAEPTLYRVTGYRVTSVAFEGSK